MLGGVRPNGGDGDLFFPRFRCKKCTLPPNYDGFSKVFPLCWDPDNWIPILFIFVFYLPTEESFWLHRGLATQKVSRFSGDDLQKCKPQAKQQLATCGEDGRSRRPRRRQTRRDCVTLLAERSSTSRAMPGLRVPSRSEAARDDKG